MFGGTEITILGNNFGIKPFKYVTYDSYGSYQTYTAANDGAYVLETWGANGGGDDPLGIGDDSSASIGGYSTGTVNLSAGDILYVYVGRAGCSNLLDDTNAGGWNGGGNSNGVGCAGGDATDIRLFAHSDPLNLSSLQSRIIVAGGGGGDAYSVNLSDYEILDSDGGVGGGTAGGDGEITGTQYVAATGGTQIAGGTPGYRTAEQSVSTGFPGTFGAGGATQEVGEVYNEGGGGGGGWFGGGAGASYDDSDNIGSGSSGGGGSGYVFTSTSDKTGYSGNIPDSRFYLSSASTIEEGSGPTNPNGTGLVGGYARITNNDMDISSELNYQVILDPDGTPAPCNVIYWDNTQIICTTTTHAVGTVDVKMSNVDGWYTKTAAFAYEIPYEITGVALNFGPTTGGNSTTIFGSGFSPSHNLVVSIDGVECLSTTYVSETVLNCVTPAGTAGAKDVSIDSGNNPVTFEGGFTYMASSGNIQDFSSSSCSSMPLYSGKVLTDARDSKLYRVRKMPDNKCWMVDNLAYIGGGTNTYGDTVATGSSGAGVLVASNGTASTISSNWTATTGVTTRFYTNNSTEYLSTQYGDTRCSATSATGSDVMASTCGNQIIYNWCAAMGLDSGTTPTCSGAVRAGYGTGYVEQTSGGPKVGIIGKANGVGGESKGNASAANQAGVNSSTVGSICPAGWRLPVGRVQTGFSTYSDVYSEWKILNESFYLGTPFTDTTSTTINAYPGYWQPAGTLPAGGAGSGAAFGTVSAGYLFRIYGLYDQSSSGGWWASSLSSPEASATTVRSNGVNPGSSEYDKYSGMAVRCVLQ
jgi:uncharacterized protein (TIGR02145 family)